MDSHEFMRVGAEQRTHIQEPVVPKRTPREFGYYQAAEWEPHEGTWLQWPHDRIYAGYQMKLEHTWLAMTGALRLHETVHIIAKDEQHRDHIAYLLNYFGIGLQNIDLRVIPTDDVWVRDNGPIFIVNDQGDLAITDWNFNGWGGRFDHPLDAKVSARLGEQFRSNRFSDGTTSVALSKPNSKELA